MINHNRPERDADMSTFKINLSTEDAELILSGKKPSIDAQSELAAALYQQDLNRFTDEELREECERIFDPELIIDMFFGQVFSGTMTRKTTRQDLIEILVNFREDSYEDPSETSG